MTPSRATIANLAQRIVTAGIAAADDNPLTDTDRCARASELVGYGMTTSPVDAETLQRILLEAQIATSLANACFDIAANPLGASMAMASQIENTVHQSNLSLENWRRHFFAILEQVVAHCDALDRKQRGIFYTPIEVAQRLKVFLSS